MKARPVWAVVRIDHFQESLYEDAGKRENPARTLVSVTGVYRDEVEAVAHATRLAESRDPAEIEYFAAETRAIGDLMDVPVILVRVNSFCPGERLRKEQIVVGPIWPSEAMAQTDVAEADADNREHSSFSVLQTARMRPSSGKVGTPG